MAWTRLLVDSATKSALGPGTLAELRRTLRPVDCQTCGLRFGRWEAAALAIEAVDEDAVVSLHHRGCQPPGWQDVELDRLRPLPHQTWRARLLKMTAPGHDDLAFLVNPSYEVARLVRDAEQWRVGTLDLFAHCGLGQELLDGVMPLPSLSAVVDTDRLAIEVNLLGTVVEQWDIGGASFPPEVAKILATKDWLTVAVTTALDASASVQSNPIPTLVTTRQVHLGAAAIHYTEAAQRLQTSDVAGQDTRTKMLAYTIAAVEMATGVKVDGDVIEAAVASVLGDGEPITQLSPESRTRAAAFIAQPYATHNSWRIHVMATAPAAAAAYHELFSSLGEITGRSAALLTREPASEEILAEYQADVVVGTPEQFLATHERHRQNAGDWGPDETRAHLALAAGPDVRHRAGDLIARYPRFAFI